jgi:signal transduction histidine kinase
MRGVTARFVMLIATAAVAPLVVYGVVSIKQLQSGTERSVTEGNRQVASQAAEQIKQYIENNQRVLRSLGAELRAPELQDWQRSRMLRDYVLDFPEFREISLLDRTGAVLATSSFSKSAATVPPAASVTGQLYVSPLRLDDDLLPTATLGVSTTTAQSGRTWIVGEIALEELWRMVDRIRVGSHGYASLLSESGVLVAHGNPDKKRQIAVAARSSSSGALAGPQYKTSGDKSLLYVEAPVAGLNWKVGVEQPTSEAFRLNYELRRQLLMVIGAALLGTLVVGYLWARTFITRIFALKRATLAIGQGRLDARVALTGDDELKQLGDSFNSMADNIVRLQENVRQQERQAMFGRIAAGLVHDLSHPIQNIGNSCKLIQRMYDDIDYRSTFKRTVEREMVVVKRVLDDLRNIAQPIPLERFPVEVDRALGEVVESMQEQGAAAGLTVRREFAAPGAFIDGDLFALGRVYRNLIVNAIQATAPGGLVAVATELTGPGVRIRVYDTGCGIPPERLGRIFEDFVTTKRRGLGLGLAISKKIVEQLGGTIAVSSEVGKGTTFVLEFPRTKGGDFAPRGPAETVATGPGVR